MAQFVNNKTYVEIDETVVIHGLECVCKPIDPGLGCGACILLCAARRSECNNYCCNAYERPDGNYVVFIKI